ncbi:MAG: hypothetical protein M3162_07640 [Thermoproteota archaeon]|nr:hypothetical protein [Thermoproteota archaeon]
MKMMRSPDVQYRFIGYFAGLGLLLLSFPLYTNINHIFAQHHGTAPPLAALGDRMIKMSLNSQPSPVDLGKDTKITMSLTDENTGEKIKHVTYRISIGKDGNTIVSNFFHSHAGDLSILVKNADISASKLSGTFDILTNSYVPDPSGMISITGPLFTEPGKYTVDAEIITIDNDKTDLSQPLKYNFTLLTSQK